MSDDVKIPISTPGAKESAKQIKGVSDALGRVGQAGKSGGESATRATSQLDEGVKKLTTSVKTLVGSYLGLQGVLKIIQAIRAEHEADLQITLRQAEAMRGMMSLSQLQGMRPEALAAAQQMAVASGRPLEQVGPAYYTLLGGTAGMSPERQQGLMKQSLLMSKTDYTADLNSLVNLFSTIGTQNPKLSPQQISNLVSHTIEQAKSTPSEMAQYLPPILSTGQAAGVDPASLAAMFSFSTRRGGGVATSGTAVRATLMGVLTPPQHVAKAMAEHGFPAGGTLMEKIGWLGAHGKNLPEELLASIGGRRGIEAVAAISGNPEGFAAEIAGAENAMSNPANLVEGRLQSMYGELPTQRMLDQLRQIRVAASIEQDSPEALQTESILEFRQLMARRLGKPQAARIIGGGIQSAWAGLTGNVMGGAGGKDTFTGAMEELILEGYQPQEVLDTILPFLEEQGYAGTQVYSQGMFGYEPPKGQSVYDVFHAEMTDSGASLMQGGSPIIYQGGTHYHNDGKSDPAGKPRTPAAGR